MAEDKCFVEWKELFVSKERGNRVVHYFLKDSSGESVLAIIGTERSVRHMFYVVSEEFLKLYGAETSVHTGFRWRSRREVVNWLTSMLSKQNRQSYYRSKASKDGPVSRVNFEQNEMADKVRLARNLNGPCPDIVWSGEPWTCGKQLKHYPGFCRNGIAIAIHSFVFVMAEKENRYLAYLEDMYEDRKGQKKVKVRWFHFNREVIGVVALRNLNPREVFITPCAQVISAECVDGPAIVLTRAHYHKCAAVFPSDLLSRLHFCCRQFKNNRVKPFELAKMHGYFNQPIFSCFSADFFEDEEFAAGDEIKVGSKRPRNYEEHEIKTFEKSYPKMKNSFFSGRGLNSHKHLEGQRWHMLNIKAGEKIEFLCQDSGMRGCWFRCTVLEISRRQLKIRYDDIKDVDGCGYLEEWVPAFKVARPDRHGIRNSFRPTIRPAQPCGEQGDLSFEVGVAVDAWWSDGWWEGIVTKDTYNGAKGYQVYIPGESLFLTAHSKNIRISKDWVGDHWVDIETPNPDIVSTITAIANQETKPSEPSLISNDKEANHTSSPTLLDQTVTSSGLSINDEEDEPDFEEMKQKPSDLVLKQQGDVLSETIPNDVISEDFHVVKSYEQETVVDKSREGFDKLRSDDMVDDVCTPIGTNG
ncbi:unnamed protein product [Cuscuta epithymum]|uniref:BAH domain-containing protein n=1 Tax=Cuscuta epithymum TaxID=186058 RepID=A0AAV0E916_9ASTE|nr:unnamed protein product [Cuscuta epithymum]CAH9118203.1 unnamed protein product [Cuscuta epithymum]CAH9119990.1 unnamed protein product [Cuscuta epithymum]